MGKLQTHLMRCLFLLSCRKIETVPIVLDKTEAFSRISGYKMNWHKSEVVLESRSCFQSESSNFQFRRRSLAEEYTYIHGIHVIDDLCKDAVFKLYQEIVDQYLLEGRGELWKYLQLRNSVRSVFPINRSTEESNMIQNLFGLPNTMHSASIFHKNLMELLSVNTEILD